MKRNRILNAVKILFRINPLIWRIIYYFEQCHWWTTHPLFVSLFPIFLHSPFSFISSFSKKKGLIICVHIILLNENKFLIKVQKQNFQVFYNNVNVNAFIKKKVCFNFVENRKENRNFVKKKKSQNRIFFLIKDRKSYRKRFENDIDLEAWFSPFFSIFFSSFFSRPGIVAANLNVQCHDREIVNKSMSRYCLQDRNNFLRYLFKFRTANKGNMQASVTLSRV